jgi:hypothetical protein
MVDLPATLAIVLMAAFWLLVLGAVVYLFSLSRGIHQSLRKIQTGIEELRRDLGGAGK